MNKDNKNIFIGAAWPYANAKLHLGHAAALIGADILARYHRSNGGNVLFVSGSDCHGTPIVLSAEKEGLPPKEIAEKYHSQFKKVLEEGLGFSYDNYTTTLTKNHSEVVQDFFLKLKENGDIYEKDQMLPYCENCKRYLPDRYIEGECSICNFKSARGDQCDNCGTILDPQDLIEPKCKTCGSEPIFKETRHFFLKLSDKEDVVRDLLSKKEKYWRTNAVGFTNKLLNEGLKDRAITRDTDWGVDIPIDGYEDKKIYVWFEAVCGYYSATVEYFDKNPEKVSAFWNNEKAFHYYVHGKDNIPFHTIIWPSILESYGNLNLPDSIISSEYLNLEGQQFSKSRNWALWIDEFLNEFDSDLLRYYLIANGPETSDSDFSWDDFQSRINNELIANFGNFINRTVQLISKNFPAGVKISDIELSSDANKNFDNIGSLIESGKFRDALKEVISISEKGNKFLAQTQPWKLIKDDKPAAEKVLADCALSIENMGRLIYPFAPKVSEKISEIFGNEQKKSWTVSNTKFFQIKKSEILFDKIEDEVIKQQQNKLRG